LLHLLLEGTKAARGLQGAQRAQLREGKGRGQKKGGPYTFQGNAREVSKVDLRTKKKEKKVEWG